jgi:hypothetical protein
MSEGKRPGGLTALAVINFVIAGLRFITLLFLAGFFAIAGMITLDQMNETQKSLIKEYQTMNKTQKAQINAFRKMNETQKAQSEAFQNLDETQKKQIEAFQNLSGTQKAQIEFYQDMDETQRAQIEAFLNMKLGLFIFIFALTIVSGVLLLLSGIGYLKQKKLLGWGLGNAYGIISIVSSIVSAFMFPAEIGGGFNIGIIIGFIYPIITLVLLNTTFKEDFTN